MSGIETFLISVGVGLLFAAGGAVITNLTEEDIDLDQITDIGRGLRANTRSTEEPIKIAYGQTKLGGNDVFIGTSGDNNKNLWMVQTLAEGQCDSIARVTGVEQVFLADKLHNEYGGNVSYWFHSGYGMGRSTISYLLYSLQVSL
jgi:hypothetical protein